ncbi:MULTISPECIES: FtsL-like putative cell division protein [Myroides]|uniref:S-adenosyl-methyltransferase n=1 Tax=Myroides albus TaxID=2562892 RepID=A0A6I3LKN5_9FLAO|nr:MULTISPECIES: FtsL-like putative cell division protein [Myroides]MTG98066.1 S-adenosyl-methyltransferase [Myroides albus]MVX36296.1 S-adenosyl-methyltransferase [Myroides sp. LoEW2-1]UVD80754.1 FtsL-like putative cell division protein [Myroides albus]
MRKNLVSPMDVIKAKILVHEDSAKNWAIIIYVICLCLILIWNTQAYETKVFKVTALTHEVKMLRAEFVDTRSELMELKMESTITKKLEDEGIYPSETPPTKIKVNLESKKESFWSRLWH